jgi:hypothetical protein
VEDRVGTVDREGDKCREEEEKGKIGYRKLVEGEGREGGRKKRGRKKK